MARITPKTNWVANDIPVAPDFNRIENNNEQAFAEIDQEALNRTAAIAVETSNRQNADSALQVNIDNSNSLRIAGDNALDALKISFNSLGARSYITGSVSPVTNYVFPAGLYIVFSISPASDFQYRDSGGTWRTCALTVGSFLISDGSNARISNNSLSLSTSYTLLQIK
jgi:hypothetical protein